LLNYNYNSYLISTLVRYINIDLTIYIVNTLRKGTLEVLKYLYKDNIFNFTNCFNLDKESILYELKGVKHLINIEGIVLYRPLYNLSKS